MFPSSLQCLIQCSILPSSLRHLVQFLEHISFEHNTMPPSSSQHPVQLLMPPSPLQHLVCFSKCCFWSLECCFMFWRWWLSSPRSWSQTLLMLWTPRLSPLGSLPHPVCSLLHFTASMIYLLVFHMPITFFEHNQLRHNIFYMSQLIWMTFFFKPNWLQHNVPYTNRLNCISSILAMTMFTSLVSGIWRHAQELLCASNFVSWLRCHAWWFLQDPCLPTI